MWVWSGLCRESVVGVVFPGCDGVVFAGCSVVGVVCRVPWCAWAHVVQSRCGHSSQ